MDREAPDGRDTEAQGGTERKLTGRVRKRNWREQREADRDAESEEKAERLSATEERGDRKGRNRRKQSQPERAREGDTEKDRQQGIRWRSGDCHPG